MSNVKGKLIVITGCDGSGKTTITNLLRKERPDVMNIKTPLPPYNKFREIFTGDDERNTFKTFPYFQNALKNDQRFIQSVLNSGRSVILERYIETTWAFHLTNCFLNGDDPKEEMLDMSLPKPDLTVVLTADSIKRMGRIEERTSKKDWWEYYEFQYLYQDRLVEQARRLSPNARIVDTGIHNIDETKDIINREIDKLNNNDGILLINQNNRDTI